MYIGEKYSYNNINEIISNNEDINVTCKEHGDFKITPNKHLKGVGCPFCKNTKENIFYNQFIKLFPNIKIERQKHFDWLGLQSLDFYLPDYNIAIEYQGRQHFEVVNKFGGEEAFEIIKERDIKKKKKCDENNLKIIYFSFDKSKKVFLGEEVKNIVLELKNILYE